MVIRRAGYRSTDLKATRRAPFRIHAEEDAVRLGLLFTALKTASQGSAHRGGGPRHLVHGARRGVLLVQQSDGRVGAGDGFSGR